MKIKCPSCGLENYFTGIEDGVNKFCSKCNTPLAGPEIMLDMEKFCDMLIEWVVTTFDFKRKKGFLNKFIKDVEELGIGKTMEDKYFEEIIYFYMWLAYINCRISFQNVNKINDYFSHFINKIHRELFKSLFHRYKREKLIKNLKKKLNGYTDAYNLLIKGDSIFNKSSLGREFYKNLYGRETIGIIKGYVFTTFVYEELKFSFKTLAKVLTRYKI
jgi:hypothetical protein